MPIIALSSPFAAFHGSVGSPLGGPNLVLYSTDKSNAVCRTYVVPANPQSTNQMLMRGFQSTSTNAYSGLTAAQAAAWVAAAEEIHLNNILNLTYELSGINLFVMINFFRQLRDIAILEDVPTILKPPIPTAVTTVTLTSATVLTIVGQTPGLPDADFAMVRVSRPLPSIVRQGRMNDVRLIGTPLSQSVVHPVSEVVTFSRTITSGDYAEDDRVAVEITPLSVDHFPGTKFLEPNINVDGP